MADGSNMHVVRASRAHMRVFQDWALAEGWRPGVGDVDAFHATDPEGFYIGFEGETPIATISVVSYATNYAFLGYYIVAPKHRGRGLGKRLWDSALASTPGASVGLDGVLEQVPMYESAGFETAYFTRRYSATVGRLQEMLRVRAEGRTSPHSGADDPGVGDSGVRIEEVTTESELFEPVFAFDSGHVPVPRRRFLEAWLATESPRRSFAALAGNGTVRGLATVRASLPEGVRIGPLFAHDDRVAVELLARCLTGLAPEQTCFVDVPSVNGAADELAASLGMTPGFTAARMYRGPVPTYDGRAVFGTTTLELG